MNVDSLLLLTAAKLIVRLGEEKRYGAHVGNWGTLP